MRLSFPYNPFHLPFRMKVLNYANMDTIARLRFSYANGSGLLRSGMLLLTLC